MDGRCAAENRQHLVVNDSAVNVLAVNRSHPPYIVSRSLLTLPPCSVFSPLSALFEVDQEQLHAALGSVLSANARERNTWNLAEDLVPDFASIWVGQKKSPSFGSWHPFSRPGRALFSRASERSLFASSCGGTREFEEGFGIPFLRFSKFSFRPCRNAVSGDSGQIAVVPDPYR